MTCKPLLALLLLAFTPVHADVPAKSSPVKAPPKAGTATVVKEDIPPTEGAVRVTVVTSPKLTDDATYFWDVYPEDEVTIVSEDANKIVFEVPMTPEVEYSVRWVAKEAKQKQQTVRTKVKAGHGPQPPPTPVDPPVDPTKPSPFEAPGIRSIFYFRDMDMMNYTPDQRAAILGVPWREYLKRICADDTALASGKGFTMIQPGGDFSLAPALWKKAAERPTSLSADAPWMIVGNGKSGFEGPMPKTTAEIKKIFKDLGAVE